MVYFMLSFRNLYTVETCYLGFLLWTKCRNTILNTIMSFIVYKIFEYEMCCKSKNKTETYNTLALYLKNNMWCHDERGELSDLWLCIFIGFENFEPYRFCINCSHPVYISII